MPIQAKVLCDSWNTATQDRLTTLEVKFHRFILPEVLTHRMFSRNAASSRAIPVAKQIAAVEEDPALPIFWGKNQPGMSASEEVDFDRLDSRCHTVTEMWDLAVEDAVWHARRLAENGLHKQLVNRLIEPYMWTTMIISATEWNNFFKQRRPPGGKFDPKFPAQPEIQQLAIEIHNAIKASDPVWLKPGEWHMPLLNTDDSTLELPERLMVSAARCARVSYLTHDGVRDVEKDKTLAERLIREGHYSPLEHQALVGGNYGNFKGFTQYRHFVERAKYVVTCVPPATS
jgi:thymidylate synthase ThyX